MRPACNHPSGGAYGWSICLLASLLPAIPPAAGQALRYDLAVGDRLAYERRVQVTPLEGDSPLQRDAEQLQIWCLASEKNEKLVLADIVRIVDQHAGPTRGALFHLDPRGRRRFCTEILARISELDPIFELIPILPPALEAGPAWLTEPDHFGRRRRCTRADEDASAHGLVRVDFVLEDPTGVAAACGVTQRGSYWFDPQAGIVVRVEFERRDRAAKQRVLSVTRLHTRLKQQPFWCTQRIQEADRFLRTLRLEDRLLHQITTEPDQIERILPRIERLWSELALETAREPQSPFHRLARARQAAFVQEAGRYRERAELAGQWLGKSAAHWSLQTPEDETIRSEAVRDRVVIEYFWSADSLCSLRSFEILRDLQHQLPVEKFRIVCLNIDADLETGRRAARLCGAGLTHVLAGPPAGGEPPRELPVFRVLDRDSTVVGVYFGWQPALAEKIGSLGR